MILKNSLIDLVIAYFIALSGGQTCVNNPNVNQVGQVIISSGRQVIVPRAKFNCSGRITNVTVSMQSQPVIPNNNLPLFQVWHPTSLNSSTYNKIGEVQLPAGEFVGVGVGRSYFFANLTLNGNSQIKFQSGDVIGYYQPSSSHRSIGSIQSSGFTSYSNTVSSPLTSIDISTVDNTDNNHQPLIAVMFDIRCNNLSIPTNGNSSCSSGTVGVGYEGDTCSFTCNTGYELTGSDTRTCQSDGSWNGTDNDCRRILCPPLDNPNNEMINCSLGDDNLTSYEDICSFTCNTGYELTGSDTRTCQSNGSWSSNNNSLCKRVKCTSLSSPTNGNISCNSTDVSHYEDHCSFSCDPGYELTGSSSRQCLSNRSWSGEPVTCNILKCSNPELEITNSQSIGNCNLTYGSRCLLNCLSGFSASGTNELVCDEVNEERTSVKWRSLGDDFTCVDDTTSSTGDNNGDGEASSDDSNAAAIGGAIGGALVLLLIIVLILAVILVCVRMSQKKQNTPSNVNSYSNKMYEASSSIIPVHEKPAAEYEEANFARPQKDNHSVVETALSTLERTSGPVYAFPNELIPSIAQPGLSNNGYEVPDVSHYEITESLEAEKKIYETPCEGEESIGPVYCVPPPDEQKIYEEFEGKRFRKIHHKELVTIAELGSGEFGTVTRGKWISSPQKEIEVAIKALNPDASDKDRLRFIQEAAIMCQFDHENVVKLYGVVTESPIMIVLEYMSQGDLRSLLLKFQSSDIHPKLPIVLLKFCQEIAAGMAYLSGKQFVHRDLAARNILVSEKITCKIADFGMARDLTDDNYYITTGGRIPVRWTAPEALLYRKYSIYSDVWGFGCVLYEIWSLGHKPFEGVPIDEAVEKISNGYRLPPPPGCPRTIYRTMIKCWNPDPRSRPQFGQLANVLAGNSGYLLGWSDEDKRGCNKEAMTLGATLKAANNLYNDLQLAYKQTQTQ